MPFVFFSTKDVFAASISGRYECFKGGTLLSSNPISDVSLPNDIYFRCPSGWSNANFYIDVLDFNYDYSHAYNEQNSFFSWIPSAPMNYDKISSNDGVTGFGSITNSTVMTNVSNYNPSVNGSSVSFSSFFYITPKNGSGDYYWQILRGFNFSSTSQIANLSATLSQNGANQSIINNLNEYQQNIINNQNKNAQDILDSNKKLNDSITDSDTSGSTGSFGDFFDSFKSNNYGLTGIITKPLELINKLTSNTCTPIKLKLMNNDFEIPCMSTFVYSKFQDFLKLYQTITFGLIAYSISVNVLQKVREFKNPDIDKIEVIDL